MHVDKVTLVLFSMHDAGRLLLPHGCVPLWPGVSEISQDIWDATTWNPPAGQAGGGEPDRGASPKPSWARLQLEVRMLEASPIEMTATLNDLCETAIINAYGARDRQHEMQKRMAGQATVEQDAERVRLVARCHEVETAIASADTLAKREAILGKLSDGTWAER